MQQYSATAKGIRRCAMLVTIGVTLLCSTVVQGAPEIKNLSLRGLQIGATTTLVIDGDGLLPEPRIELGVVVAKQTIKPNATDKRVEIEISLDGNVEAGLYPLRLVTADGVSNAALVGVDGLVQSPVVESLPALPVAVSGVIQGEQTARTSFSGKQGDAVLIEVEARRLGSQLNPVVHVYDSRRVQIGWAQGSGTLAGDMRLSVTLPADGQYAVELHDALYQGRGPGHFRLKLGQWRYSDLTLPLAVKKGTSQAVQHVDSNLDGDAKSDVQAPPQARFFPATWPAVSGFFSGAKPPLLASDHEEFVEAPASDGNLQQLATPSGVSGRIDQPRQEDRYRVAVEPKQKLRIDVMAARTGSPLDGVVTIYDESGKNVLATNDDRPGLADPGVDFTVPDGASAVVVGIKDMLGRGGREFVYRVSIQRQETPEFALALTEDRVTVPQGGSALVRVQVERKGYNGPIDLFFDGLPAGVSVENSTIPAESDLGLVLLNGTGTSQEFAVVNVVGKSTSAADGGAEPIIRTAMLPASPMTQRQPWLRQELAVALARPGAIRLAWENPEPSLPLGGKLAAEVKVSRTEGVAGPVRLSLVTTQPMPKKTVNVNNMNQQVDDVDRAIRMEGSPTIAADATEGTANLLIPGDLPERRFDLVLRGELLSADGKQVLATAYTPILQATPARPVMIELTSAAKLEARAGQGEAPKLAGKLVRQPGFTQPVRVMVTGLPGGAPPIFEDVPADKSEFELALRLPFRTSAGELKGLQVVGVGLSADGPQGPVRTNATPLVVNVVKGEAPAIEPPLKVFEDEEEFTQRLTEGSGQVRLENGQKFSGNASARVTPDQRFNPALPGLGVKIRKEPGPGEYRYLRFAWKKQGGNQICLQLNHDGQWGPTASRPGAKFRYHAGPIEPFGASLQVDAKLPNRFVLVTRDLYADFGEFTLTGLALSAIDGQFAAFDHIYLGRTVDDLDSVRPEGK